MKSQMGKGVVYIKYIVNMTWIKKNETWVLTLILAFVAGFIEAVILV